jgi:hypothetical protein
VSTAIPNFLDSHFVSSNGWRFLCPSFMGLSLFSKFTLNIVTLTHTCQRYPLIASTCRQMSSKDLFTRVPFLKRERGYQGFQERDGWTPGKWGKTILGCEY